MRVGSGGANRQLSKIPYPKYSAGLGGVDHNGAKHPIRHGKAMEGDRLLPYEIIGYRRQSRGLNR